jgi:hypothetical protein
MHFRQLAGGVMAGGDAQVHLYADQYVVSSWST